MFIVLAAPHYPPRNIGGTEFFVQALARWLHGRGHRVEVVCVEQIASGLFPRVSARVDRSEGFPVHRLTVRWRAGPLGLRDRFDNPAMGLWFKAFFHSRQPDLFHLHSGYLLTVAPLRAAMKAGLPTVVSLHDLWFLCAHHTLLRPSGRLCPGPEEPAGCAYCWLSQSRRYRWLESALGRLGRPHPHRAAGRLLNAWPPFGPWVRTMAERLQTTMGLLNRVSAIHVTSTFLERQHRAFGMRSERVYRIPGFPPAEVRPGPDRRDPTGLHVIYLGQIAPHKGVHVLVEGVRRAKRMAPPGRTLRLTLYGNDQAFPAYARSLRKAIGEDPEIRLAGVLPRERIGEALAEADLLAVPSIWPENMPLAVLEALAAGVPVLASEIGGLPELIQHGVNGWQVPPGDADAIAAALVRFLEAPEVLEALRAGARPVHTMEAAMTAMMVLYRDVVGKQETAAWVPEPVGSREG